MAFVSDMFDQLRDLLNDATDTQVPFATKKLFLNRGIARMWPRIGRIVSDSTVTIAEDTYEYAMPAGFVDGLLLSVEVETSNTNEFQRYDAYDVIYGDEDLGSRLVITGPLPATGRKLRLRYYLPIASIAAASYAAAQAESWNGPDRAMGLPVLYAMGMCSARKLDDRQDTIRYNTTDSLNGVTDQDIMAASQMWFGQFEAELADMERPLPPARD